MSTTVRISEGNKKLIDDIAGQLKTSRKEVVDMIFTWFFSFDVEAAMKEVDEDDDDDDDNDDNGDNDDEDEADEDDDEEDEG